MIKFIENVTGLVSPWAWMWILAGVVGAVFVFGIIMMIVKKRHYAVGRSTAVAALIAAFILTYICNIEGEFSNSAHYAFFLLGAGGIAALIGGFIAMLVKRKCKKHDCHGQGNSLDYDEFRIPEEARPVPAPYPAEPAMRADYSVEARPTVTETVYGGSTYVSPETEALLSRIKRTCEGGAPLPEMRETAMLLQKERAKPENKNNPAVYAKLNKALIDLLNAIQKR